MTSIWDTPIWAPDLGPQFGTLIWDVDLGPRFGTPIWDPDLGPRFGTPIWDPNLGPRFGTTSWDPDLGPLFWTPMIYVKSIFKVGCVTELFGRPSLRTSLKSADSDFETTSDLDSDSACLFVYAFIL
jgi:hypothetical protein